MREAFTLDLGNGLNAGEAALLAIITHPYIKSIREKKGLKMPQLINSGQLKPPRIAVSDESVAAPWFPRERVQLLKETADRLSGAPVYEQMELESAWLEWQASEAARLALYRKVNSKEIIDLLRQIEKLYKEIYKTTSKAEYREEEKYQEMRATARLGYRKMKKSGKVERKELSISRADLNHALSLPTNIDTPLEDNVTFTWPGTIPSAKELTRNLSLRRLDLLAFKKGIDEKNLELMGYIRSRFNVVNISILADKKEHWLDTAATGVYMIFPLFTENHGVAGLMSTNGELFTKNYKHRLKVATLQISRLVEGMTFIAGELERIDATLPALQKEAEAGRGENSPVAALQKKKTLLAVRLLRLRLLRKFLDTGFALEIASGTRIIETPGL
ncbi:MAG: hypothetical protein ACE5EZ_04540 [Thermodesulfobacteriota bacterium]